MYFNYSKITSVVVDEQRDFCADTFIILQLPKSKNILKIIPLNGEGNRLIALAAIDLPDVSSYQLRARKRVKVSGKMLYSFIVHSDLH